MHEASLVRTLIRQVEALASEQGKARVVEVSVSIGEFSGVEPDLLRIAFERQIFGTALCDARLSLVRVPLEGFCSKCQLVFAIEAFRFICPGCGGSHVNVNRGEEMMLEGVVFEENATAGKAQLLESTCGGTSEGN